MCLQYKSFENTVLAISPFPTVFSTDLAKFLPFSSNLKLLSAKSFRLEESEISRLGKGKSFSSSPHEEILELFALQAPAEDKCGLTLCHTIPTFNNRLKEAF